MRFRRKRACLYLIFVSLIFGITYLALRAHENDGNEENVPIASRINSAYRKHIDLKTSTPKHLSKAPMSTSAGKTVPEDHDATPSPGGIHHVESTCSGISSLPLHLAQDDTWAVLDRNKTTLVYSAYYVPEVSSITIIGTRVRPSRKRDPNKPYTRLRYTCQQWVQKDDMHVMMTEETASVRDLPEHHGMNYTTTFFHCPTSSKYQPTFVSLVTRTCNEPNNLLRVRYRTHPNKHRSNFTVCLTPLNKNYNKAYELVEWIELNRLLGADKFTIFNYSSALNVVQVLDYYAQLDLVDIVQWNLPLKHDAKKQDIHYYGQVAALQDCLYRNKGKSEFLVNIDLDEFIIPRGDNISTWSELLQMIKVSASGYLFQNTFFKKEWADTTDIFPEQQTALKYNMVTLLKTKREMRIFKHKNRSKYIVRPDDLDRLLIHDFPKVTGSGLTKVEYIAADTALLHHYRNWHQYADPENVKVKDDIVLRKYGARLAANVERVWETLADVETGL